MPPTFSISTQASVQHGYTPRELLLEQRTVRLSAHINGVDGVRRMYELRKSLNEICNPLLGAGALIYENSNGIWQTSGTIVAALDVGMLPCKFFLLLLLCLIKKYLRLTHYN